MTASFLGFGMSAIAARRSTIPCSFGSCSGVTILAPVVIKTILSEPKYWKTAITTAIPKMNGQGRS